MATAEYAQTFFDACDDIGFYRLELKCVVTNGKLIIGHDAATDLKITELLWKLKKDL